MVVEVYWGARGQVYVTPVGPDEIGVALLTRVPHLRLDACLAPEFPPLTGGSAAPSPTSTERKQPSPLRGSSNACCCGSTALVGDASGTRSTLIRRRRPLGFAFCQATALADALAASDLQALPTAPPATGSRPRSHGIRPPLSLDRAPGYAHARYSAHLAWRPSLARRPCSRRRVAHRSDKIGFTTNTCRPSIRIRGPGNPRLARESDGGSGCLLLADGTIGRAAVPSGASTGEFEAVELRATAIPRVTSARARAKPINHIGKGDCRRAAWRETPRCWSASTTLMKITVDGHR